MRSLHKIIDRKKQVFLEDLLEQIFFECFLYKLTNTDTRRFDFLKHDRAKYKYLKLKHSLEPGYFNILVIFYLLFSSSKIIK